MNRQAMVSLERAAQLIRVGRDRSAVLELSSTMELLKCPRRSIPRWLVPGKVVTYIGRPGSQYTVTSRSYDRLSREHTCELLGGVGRDAGLVIRYVYDGYATSPFPWRRMPRA